MAEVKQTGIDGDALSNYMELDPTEVFVPEGRFRTARAGNIAKVQESISTSGQLQPIIVDKNGNLIDGAHRLKACENLGISVKAIVLDEVDPDKIALMEIDTNLSRVELTETEYEDHLKKRKELYLKLFPETAQGGVASNKASFVKDTAEKTGESERNLQRKLKRGTESTDEARQARDAGEISNADLDKLNSKTKGQSEEEKNKALKDIIKAKQEAKKAKDQAKNEEVTTTQVVEEATPVSDALKAELDASKVENEELKAKLEKAEAELDKLKKRCANYKARIDKAKEKNPNIKI